MNINIVYDSSVASAPAGFQTAVQAAVAFWDQAIANPINVTISFGWGEVDGTPLDASTIGENVFLASNYTYSQVVAALTAAATSPSDIAAATTFPATDPTHGGVFAISSAEAKALGIFNGDPNSVDGFVGLDATTAFTFDPANRGVDGKFDAIGVLEHEISEVLGRVADVGLPDGGGAAYAPLDLFRYVDTNDRTLTPGVAAFSVDGQNLVSSFNDSSKGGDAGDWNSNYVYADSFNAFADEGVANTVSLTDLQVMDALGYTLAPPTTQPLNLSQISVQPPITAWAFDAQNGLIYVETQTGFLESYNPSTHHYALLLNMGPTISGLAVSADGLSLYVGVKGTVAGGGSTYTSTLDRISLADLSVQALTYESGSAELGPGAIVVAPDGQAYFSTGYFGSGQTPVRQFQTENASFNPTVVSAASALWSYRVSPPGLILSEDGRYVLVDENEGTSTRLLVLNTVTGAGSAAAVVDGNANSGRADINSASGLIANVQYPDGVVVYNFAFQVAKNFFLLQANGAQLIGAHFNEAGSQLFLWSQSQHDLLVESTTDWSQIAVIPVAQVTGVAGDGSVTGSMALADAGRLLLLNNGAGFQIIDLAPQIHRTGFAGDGKSEFLIENTSGAIVTGEVSNGHAAFTTIAGLGPEWSFHGAGDLRSDGKDAFLIESSAGAVMTGEVSSGQVTYHQVGALGSEWSFRGVGDFLANGHDQFLIENSSGAIMVGDASIGTAEYTPVAALGAEWAFTGVGDFYGIGHDDFLIENTSGAVVIGDVASGLAIYTQVAALGPEWKFEGVGDFLGVAAAQFLIENSSGAVDVGQIIGDHTRYTQLTALGPEWKFVGAGDFFGEGHDQFLIENTTGAVVIGDWQGGQIHFSQVTALGQEWAFH